MTRTSAMKLRSGVVLASCGVRLAEPLASGAMGCVWAGVREADGLRVAVKLPLAAAESAFGPETARRLADEARAAASVPHPSLVAILATGEEPDVGPVVVYEFLGGGTLRDELRRRARRPWPGALEEVGAPLLEALAALHAGGVVHRDVKPENVLRAEGGPWKLGDLGLALFEGRGARTATGVLVGTPEYLAPEVLRGSASRGSCRADLYAAAILLIECATGRNPFQRDTTAACLQAHLAGRFDATVLGRSGVGPTAARALVRSLAADPGERPESAAEFLAELRGAPPAAGAPTLDAAALRAPAKPRAARPDRRPLAALVLVASALVAGLGLERGAGGSGTAPAPAAEALPPALRALPEQLRASGDPPRAADLLTLLDGLRGCPGSAERTLLLRSVARTCGATTALGRACGALDAWDARLAAEEAAPWGARPDVAAKLLAALDAAMTSLEARGPPAEEDRLALLVLLVGRLGAAGARGWAGTATVDHAALGTLERLADWASPAAEGRWAGLVAAAADVAQAAARTGDRPSGVPAPWREGLATLAAVVQERAGGLLGPDELESVDAATLGVTTSTIALPRGPDGQLAIPLELAERWEDLQHSLFSEARSRPLLLPEGRSLSSLASLTPDQRATILALVPRVLGAWFLLVAAATAPDTEQTALRTLRNLTKATADLDKLTAEAARQSRDVAAFLVGPFEQRRCLARTTLALRQILAAARSFEERGAAARVFAQSNVFTAVENWFDHRSRHRAAPDPRAERGTLELCPPPARWILEAMQDLRNDAADVARAPARRGLLGCLALLEQLQEESQLLHACGLVAAALKAEREARGLRPPEPEVVAAEARLRRLLEAWVGQPRRAAVAYVFLDSKGFEALAAQAYDSRLR